MGGREVLFTDWKLLCGAMMTMLMCSNVLRRQPAVCVEIKSGLFALSEQLGSVTRGTMNLVVSLCLLCLAGAGTTVSLYEYFTGEAGISSGLTATGQEFRLNGRDIKLLSGSLHYFRSPQSPSVPSSLAPAAAGCTPSTGGRGCGSTRPRGSTRWTSTCPGTCTSLGAGCSTSARETPSSPPSSTSLGL